jgi:hypothetical protein
MSNLKCPYSKCPIQNVLFKMSYSKCPFQNVLFKMSYSKCPVQNVLFKMSYFKCIFFFLSSHKDFVFKSILIDCDNSSKRYLECRFCGQNFMKRHLKLFTIHVEQKHEAELNEFLNREAFLAEGGERFKRSQN